MTRDHRAEATVLMRSARVIRLEPHYTQAKHLFLFNGLLCWRVIPVAGYE